MQRPPPSCRGTTPERALRRGQFRIIYADPPWSYKSWSGRADRSIPRRGRGVPYPTMPTSAIAALPVQELAAADCVLFLWVPYPFLPDGLAVLSAWGFRFKTVAFSWVKLNPSGNGFALGLGHWTRANPEICILATRGHPARASKGVPNLIVSPRGAHSKKPNEVRERIVALCGDLPRVELFARQHAEGWDVWGNEVASTVHLQPH